MATSTTVTMDTASTVITCANVSPVTGEKTKNHKHLYHRNYGVSLSIKLPEATDNLHNHVRNKHAGTHTKNTDSTCTNTHTQTAHTHQQMQGLNPSKAD